MTTGIRTTIYLVDPAAKVIERVRTVHLDRYGIATSVSAIVARLLLGETVGEIVERPYRSDLSRIASERDRLHEELRRVQTRRRMNDLHRIHREVAELYPPLKRITNTLGRARRRSEPLSPDFTEAKRLEESLDELMAACADAIVPGRRR